MPANCSAEHRDRYDRAVLITDGVFSMDGDLAPLAELNALAEEYDAWLMSDDAHGLGVVGGGRGSTFVGNAHIPVPLQMGTLSKAVGAYGGYLCASAAAIDLIRNRARTLIYSTGLPPSVRRRIHRRARPDRARTGLRPRCRCRRPRLSPARSACPRRKAPVVPLVDRRSPRGAGSLEMLAAEGFLVAAIRPPTVPGGHLRGCASRSPPLHPDDRHRACCRSRPRTRILGQR